MNVIKVRIMAADKNGNLLTRGEVDEVLAEIQQRIEAYGSVSIADLCDLLGETCNYKDNEYGWTDIRNAKTVRTHNGYIIELPPYKKME